MNFLMDKHSIKHIMYSIVRTYIVMKDNDNRPHDWKNI